MAQSNRGIALLEQIPPDAIYYAIYRLADGTDIDIELYDKFDIHKTDSVGVLTYLLYSEFRKVLYLIGTTRLKYEEVDYWPGDIDIDMTLVSGALLRGHVIGAHPCLIYDTPVHRLIAYTFVSLWDLEEYKAVKYILPQSKTAPLERMGYTEAEVRSWGLKPKNVADDLQLYMEMPEYRAYYVVFRLCELILKSLKEDDNGGGLGFDTQKYIEAIFEGYLRSQIWRFLSYTSNTEKIKGFTTKEFLFKRSRVQLGIKLGEYQHDQIPDIIFMAKPERKTDYLIIVDSKTSQDITRGKYIKDTQQIRDYLEGAADRYKTVKKVVGIVFYFAFADSKNFVESSELYGCRHFVSNGVDQYMFGIVCRLRKGMKKEDIWKAMDSRVRFMIEEFIMNGSLEEVYGCGEGLRRGIDSAEDS